MCLYDGLLDWLKNIDVAILPINGRDAERNAQDIIGNINCEEAVLLAKQMNAGLLIPVHHDLYEVNKADPSEFVAAVNHIDPARSYRFFTPGEVFLYQNH